MTKLAVCILGAMFAVLYIKMMFEMWGEKHKHKDDGMD